MKEILKNLSSEYEMKYDEVFTSPDNRSIRQKLVPELLKSLKPRHNPSYVQLNDWLRALASKGWRSVSTKRSSRQDQSASTQQQSGSRGAVRNSFRFIFIFINIWLFVNIEKGSTN